MRSKITNNTNGKYYIGVAKKWVKLVSKKYYIYGGNGRFKRHLSNAISTNIKLTNDCPDFYGAIREFGKQSFSCHILKIVNNNHKMHEKEEILKYKSHDPEYGYNILISTEKPLTDIRLNSFSKKKESGNKNRAINGEMRHKEHNINLPPNIYYRSNKNKEGNILHEGYFVQIKTNGKLVNKAFLSDKLTLDEKLKKAKDYLKEINNILNK